MNTRVMSTIISLFFGAFSCVNGVEVKIDSIPAPTNGVIIADQGSELKFKAVYTNTTTTNVHHRGYRWNFSPFCNPNVGSNQTHMVTIQSNALGTNFTVKLDYWGTVGSNSFYCEYATTNVLVVVPKLELIQSNYPSSTGKIINEGEKSYITGDPEPPHLFAHIVSTNLPFEVKWTFDSTYRRRGTSDNKSFSKTLPLSSSLNITNETAGEFFGGDVTIKAEIVGLWKKTLKFKINGKNPPDEIAKAYIEDNDGEFWFAWAIAKHESRQGQEIYNQFNPGGRFSEEPNFGIPNGWGIFQRDDTGGGIPVTTKQVWSWKENVDVAVNQELPQKKQITDNYFNRVRRTHPAEYEEPPDLIIEGVSISGRDALTVTLYNGGGGRSLSRIWKFDPKKPSGQRWEWNPPNAPRSNEPYVNKIMKEFNGN